MGLPTIRAKLLFAMAPVIGLMMLSLAVAALVVARTSRATRELVGEVVSLERASGEAMLAVALASDYMEKALLAGGDDPEGPAQELTERFRKHALTFEVFANAMLWGSESVAFRGVRGGRLYAEWQRRGGVSGETVPQAPAGIRQLVGMADLYYAGFLRHAESVVEARHGARGGDSVSARESDGTIAPVVAIDRSKADRYKELAIGALQESLTQLHEHFRKGLGGIDQMQRTAWIVLLTSSCGIAVLALIAGLVFSDRLVARPLRRLHEGTRIVGMGNLDHRVGTKAGDEIGQLSRSFDLMVENLKCVTASRDELDREIGRRREAEEALRRTMSELERSNQDLEQFAYAASHDLQEPLRKVVAFGSLLEREYGQTLADEGRQYVASMRGATQRMQQLISDLLAYSRVSTRGRAFVPVDLNETVAGVLCDLETVMREADAKVDVARLPVVSADPTQMRQLLQNLIGNALKFHARGVRPEIRVYAAEASAVGAEDNGGAGLCGIVVSDNGIGFDDRHAERIFGLFQRLHSRGEYAGTGIGLATCRRIVDRHGGTISARSKPGEGAAFTVRIPMAREDGTGGEHAV